MTYLDAVLPELFQQLAGSGIHVVLLLPSHQERKSTPDWCDVRVMPLASRNWFTRLVFDHLVLPLWLLAHRDAVLFCSGSFPPFIKTVPTAVLVRNAIYFEPEFLQRESPLQRWLLKAQAALISMSARTCVAIHYPSEYMRGLVEAYDPSLRRHGVRNYYGIQAEMLRARLTGRPVAVPDHAPTFLYVMNYTLQKNLGYLLEALVLAKDRGVKVQVVVTSWLTDGRPGPAGRDRAVIARHDLIASGYLAPVGPKFGAELIRLYQEVDGCVFPSICESFGHPLVEALALGKPLVCTDRPYAREICGTFGWYVDPRRPEDLVRLWERWDEHAAEHVPPGLADLTNRFSWARHVSTVLETLLPRRVA